MYGTFNLIPSRYLPKVAFFFMFAYLSSLHIYRMVTDYMGWKLDASAVLMVLVIKITTLACNYCDGKRLDTPEAEFLTPSYKEFAVKRMPTLLEYYSYLFFFPTFLSGPSFHFAPYLKWINDELYVDQKYNPSGKMPDPTWAVLEAFGLAVVLVGVHLVVSGKFPLEIFFQEHGVDHMSLFVRHVYLQAAVIGVRCKYYFIWKLAEGAGTLTGLGFSGYDKQGIPTWTRLTNIYLIKIESFGCLRDITTYWNCKTGEWLKNYIYFRQTKNPNKDRVPTYALYLTNTASAVWHGFYPGYYFAFVYAAFTTDIARQLRALFRPMATSHNGKEEKKNISSFFCL